MTAPLPKMASKFENLNPAITSWLRSDTVLQLIIELNKKYDAFGAELNVIPALLVNYSIGKTRPADFCHELERGLPHLEEKNIEEIATSLKERVFKPIKTVFKDAYGIDINEISTTSKTSLITARTMDMGAPAAKSMPATAPKPPTVPPPVRAPQAPAMPKARVMEMAQVIDVRRPPLRATEPLKQASVAPAPKPAAPAAQTMKIEGDFSAGGPKPGQRGANNYATTNKTEVKKPEGDSTVLSTEKEFGLAEVIPKPPAPQELEVYADHHPTVE